MTLSETFLQRLTVRHGRDLVPVTHGLLSLINADEIKLGARHVSLIGTLKSDEHAPVAIRVSSAKRLSAGEVGVVLSFLTLDEKDESDKLPSLHVVMQAQSDGSFKYGFTHLDLTRKNAKEHEFLGEVKRRLESSGLIHLEPDENNEHKFRRIQTRPVLEVK